MSGRIVHLVVDIRGLMRRPRRDLSGWLRDETGRYLTAEQAWNALADELARGRKVLPYGEPCEGFNYETGCPGHEGKDTVVRAALPEAPT